MPFYRAMDIGTCLFVLSNCVVLLAQQAKKGKDILACVPGPPNQNPSQEPPYPPLPTIYSARVESNIVDKNYTTDCHEYYDQRTDSGAIHQLERDHEVWGVYDYLAGELLIVTSQNGDQISSSEGDSCKVVDLNTAGDRHMFNYTIGKKSKTVFSAYGAFSRGSFMTEYKDTNVQYLGQSTVRGIKVNGWRICVWWDDIDATLNIDWYFAVPQWNVSSAVATIPVRAHVYGLIYDTPTTPRHIEHFYEYADFRHKFSLDRDFEVPKGTYCPGRKNMKTLPTPPTFFSFEEEIVSLNQKKMGWTKEYYDYESSLFRHDYFSTYNQSGMYTGDLITEIHDFATGVAYIMDKKRWTCTTQLIEQVGIDDKSVDNFGHVRIRTAKEFFDFDKAPYAYEGVRNTRGIDCDVWIANRQDWPSPDLNINSTWEWSFATKKWLDTAGESHTHTQPVQLEVFSKQTGTHYAAHIYNFDSEKPDFWSFNVDLDFNIEVCYNSSTRHDFQFAIPGSFKAIVLQNEYMFKRAVLKSLMLFLNVSQLRITRMRLDYSKNDIIVSFTLLDKAPLKGDVITPIDEPPLEFASRKFTRGINNGNFAVKLRNSTTNKTNIIKAIPYSVSHNPVQIVKIPGAKTLVLKPKAYPYTSGDLVAIGIAMLIACFLLAAVIMVFIFKKRKGVPWSSFIPKTFTKETHEMKEEVS